MSAASKLDLFANVSLHHHYICNPISQTALPVVDNVKSLGVGVEQGQDFQRHKGVSFQTFQALYMFIAHRMAFENNVGDPSVDL